MPPILLSLLLAPGSVDALVTEALSDAAADKDYLPDRALIQCDVLVQAEIGETGWTVAPSALPKGWAVRSRTELQRLGARKSDLAFVVIKDVTLSASAAMVTMRVGFGRPTRGCGCDAIHRYVRQSDGHWRIKDTRYQMCVACTFLNKPGSCEASAP
jgi:hypothetical protein